MSNDNPNEISAASQCGMILDHLMSGSSITAMEALAEFQCFRLASRIIELKQAGHPINSQWITLSNGKRVKEYWYERQT